MEHIISHFFAYVVTFYFKLNMDGCYVVESKGLFLLLFISIKQRDKMAEDQVDVEHISLHSCLKNPSSDTDLTEHKLRAGRSP